MQIKTFPNPFPDAAIAAKEINAFRRANRNLWCVATMDVGKDNQVFTVKIKFFNLWIQRLIIVTPNGKETNHGVSADLATERAFLAHVATAITTEELDWKEMETKTKMETKMEMEMEMEAKAKGEIVNV